MDKIELMRCSIVVLGRSGQQQRPKDGKGAFILWLWDGFRRRDGFCHPTYTIPFILCIHVNCSSPANWVRASDRLSEIHPPAFRAIAISRAVSSGTASVNVMLSTHFTLA